MPLTSICEPRGEPDVSAAVRHAVMMPLPSPGLMPGEYSCGITAKGRGRCATARRPAGAACCGHRPRR
jgi:hypothetical protein